MNEINKLYHDKPIPQQKCVNRLLYNFNFVAGALLLLATIFCAVFAPLIATHDVIEDRKSVV